MQTEPNSDLIGTKFLTITQAAKVLKVSPDTLRRWEDRGIVTPARTKGGSRRYTLLDLKIARLNKRKVRFFQIPTLLKQSYINHKRDFKIAMFTSFLWIFALLAYHFLTPVFLRPTNPDLQILSDQLKESARLKIASETISNKISVIKTLVIPDETPIAPEITPPTTGSDLLMGAFGDLPKLLYTDTPDQYYSLQPLPQNQIPTLIISRLAT